MKLNDITVTRELSGALPEVMGDRHGLQQVVLNLITNAAQAVGENPRERARAITVSTWFDGQVHLRVADTGPGIPEQVLQSVFTPFFTTKEPGKGTGLGLSITYSIVESHGGHITIEPAATGAGGAGGGFFLISEGRGGGRGPDRSAPRGGGGGGGGGGGAAAAPRSGWI